MRLTNNNEIFRRLASKCFLRDVPVDVDEREAVTHVLLHLGAVVLLAIVRSTQPDILPVLPSPGDGRLGCSRGVAVQGDGPALSGQSVSAARLVDDVGRNYKWNQIKMQFILAP